MESIKGHPLFIGHRAFGSLKKYFLIDILIFILIMYLGIYHSNILYATVFTYKIKFTLLDILLIVFFTDLIILLVRHYEIAYIITTGQIYVKYGIIASRVNNYLYDQIQEASSFQTVGQRIFLWGQLNITMLITLTGQSKVEEAHLDYIHRPKHIANLMLSGINIGKE